jgi:aldehyde dehydrogenase (NAD+)
MVTRAHYERVQAYIQAGLDEGATLLVGGLGKVPGLESGNYCRPTVFVDVKPDMAIAQEEIFGPVLAVIPYADDAEAVEIANGTDYGLVAYVAGSRPHAEAVASRIRAGRVMVNEPVSDQDVPFGGFKQSGIGREFGRFGIADYLEYSAVFSA